MKLPGKKQARSVARSVSKASSAATRTRRGETKSPKPSGGIADLNLPRPSSTSALAQTAMGSVSNALSELGMPARKAVGNVVEQMRNGEMADAVRGWGELVAESVPVKSAGVVAQWIIRNAFPHPGPALAQAAEMLGQAAEDLGDLGQSCAHQLQEAASQALQVRSGISKKSNDTAERIIGNL